MKKEGRGSKKALDREISTTRENKNKKKNRENLGRRQ